MDAHNLDGGRLLIHGRVWGFAVPETLLVIDVGSETRWP